MRTTLWAKATTWREVTQSPWWQRKEVAISHTDIVMKYAICLTNSVESCHHPLNFSDSKVWMKRQTNTSLWPTKWMSIRRLSFKRRQMKSRHVIYQASSNQLIINVRPFCSQKQYWNTPIRQTLWPVAGEVCNTKYLFITAPVGGCNIFGGNWTFWAQNWCLRSGMGNQGLEWVC